LEFFLFLFLSHKKLFSHTSLTYNNTLKVGVVVIAVVVVIAQNQNEEKTRRREEGGGEEEKNSCETERELCYIHIERVEKEF
jgi:hypothetical protein